MIESSTKLPGRGCQHSLLLEPSLCQQHDHSSGVLPAVRAQWFGRATAFASSLQVEGCQNITLAGKGGRSLQVYSGAPLSSCRVGPFLYLPPSESIYDLLTRWVLRGPFPSGLLLYCPTAVLGRRISSVRPRQDVDLSSTAPSLFCA